MKSFYVISRFLLLAISAKSMYEAEMIFMRKHPFAKILFTTSTKKIKKS